MTGSLKAFCSILGTLMAVSLLANPALAQGKKKKKAAQDAPAAEAEAEGEAGGSLDTLMESAAEKKTDKKKKGEEAEAEAPAEEPVAEDPQPDEWERPPMEEKAPAKEEIPPAAEPPVHGGKPISVALLLGYGFKTDRADYGANPYGFMAGVRGGYTLDFALYLGVYFNYYLGSSQEGQTQQTGLMSETSASYMHFGAEVGYDVELGPILFRPSMGIGIAMAFTDMDTPGETVSISDLMFAPGITVLYPLDDSLFLGGDLRGQIVTGDGVSAVTLAATGGFKF